MASMIFGSIVATDTKTNLKTVFYVHKDGKNVTFTKPTNPDWSHNCYLNVKNSPEGWEQEVENLTLGGLKDAVFYPN